MRSARDQARSAVLAPGVPGRPDRLGADHALYLHAACPLHFDPDRPVRLFTTARGRRSPRSSGWAASTFSVTADGWTSVWASVTWRQAGRKRCVLPRVRRLRHCPARRRPPWRDGLPGWRPTVPASNYLERLLPRRGGGGVGQQTSPPRHHKPSDRGSAWASRSPRLRLHVLSPQRDASAWWSTRPPWAWGRRARRWPRHDRGRRAGERRAK